MQDNAALDGLYIDNVHINCVNDIDLDKTDISIRFHSNNFGITNSIINIENAWNTGQWICDGWNGGEKEDFQTQTLEMGSWNCDGIEFTASFVMMKDITITTE